MTDEEIPPGRTEVSDPPWDPWRPEDAVRLLAGVSVPWCVAAGWALTRVHPGHPWISAIADRPCPSR